MTKQELEAQANELQKQLNELSEKIAKCEGPKMFPQEGEEYWFYNPEKVILHVDAHDSDGRLNVYRTKEEAEKARDIQWAKQRVAHRIAVLNDGWFPDWSIDQVKYMIALIPNTMNFCVDYWHSRKHQPDWMYCKTIKIAEQIIEECKDDLLLIFSE